MIDECARVIRCPNCHETECYIQEATSDMSTGIVSGSGMCTRCAVRQMRFDLERGALDVLPRFDENPLDFQFSWDIVNNRAEVISSQGQHLTYEIGDKCMCEDCRRKEQEELMELARQANDQAVYAVVSGDKEHYHLLAIASNKPLAESLAGKDPDGRVIRFDTKVISRDRPFPVFIVSVGEGDRYRIIDITSDKKRAAKIATSVRGTVATFDAMPSMGASSVVRYFKYFVVLESDCDNDDEVFYVDRFSRREAGFVGIDPAPMVTRRRRYNSSLPYRFEVAAVDQRQAQEVANQLYEGINSGRFDVDEFEYNVDYRMVCNNREWEIDPCLLVAANVD